MIRIISKTKLLWLLLALLLVLSAVACKSAGDSSSTTDKPGTEAPGTTTGDTDTEPTNPTVPSEPLDLIKDGKTDFTIVVARGASQTVTRTANRLSKWFADNGVSIEVKNDGGNMNKNVPTDTYEILLGRTNRAESKAVNTDEISANGYLWKVAGRRLVIQASNDTMLEIAVGELLGSCEAKLESGNGNLTLEKELSVQAAPEARDGWLLYGIPDYLGGKLSSGTYDCGYGLNDYSETSDSNSVMQSVYNTTSDEYAAYLTRLEDAGYRKTFENSIGDNRYTSWRKGTTSLYVYYTDNMKDVRIIWDRNSTADPGEFSYSYTPGENDTSIYYAYALYHGPKGLDYSNSGQMQVIKLADNSLIVIDGGMAEQFDEAMQEGFMTFAREVTGTPEGQKVRIACWFLTHPHPDHRRGLAKVMMSPTYQASLELERMAFNYPNTQLDAEEDGIQSMLMTLSAAYPNCKMIKLHTGMKLQLADLSMEVFYTHEDFTKNTSCRSMILNKDYINDTSTVVKMTMGGVSFLVLGDMNSNSEPILVRQIPAEYLKSDIVQVAHHTWNVLDNIYDIAQAKYAIFTQSEGGSNRTLMAHAKEVLEKVQEYAPPENCFFSGGEDKSYALVVKNGKLTHDTSKDYPLYWNSWDYDWGYTL